MATDETISGSKTKFNPIAAAALSIVPGLGQIASGWVVRGVCILIAWLIQVLLLLPFESINPLVLVSKTIGGEATPRLLMTSLGGFYVAPSAAVVVLILLLFFWLWNIRDGASCARGLPLSIVPPVLILTALNLCAGWHVTEGNFIALWEGLPKMQTIAAGLLSPKVMENGQFHPVLVQSVQLIITTIYLALIGTILPIPITLMLSVFGARNLMSGNRFTVGVYGVSRSLMNLLRSIEVVIIAVMMTVAVGIGPFAGVLALAIHGIGAQGKLYSEAIEDIDNGPIEAITATGASWLQVVLYGVLPQVAPQFIAFTMYRWDINVRMATVIGLVGGGGIGFTLMQYINTLRWQQAGTAIWLIAAAVILMDWASSAVRRKFT